MSLSNLPCWDLQNVPLFCQIGSLFYSTTKLLCNLQERTGRRAAAAAKKEKNSSSRAGRETQREKEGDGVREWESKLTKCDWYSSLPNPHPPWLIQRMNNYLTEGEGGKRERARERERESEREGGRESAVWASCTTQSTTGVWVRWPLFKPTLQSSRKKKKQTCHFVADALILTSPPPQLSRLHPLKHTPTETHTHTDIHWSQPVSFSSQGWADNIIHRQAGEKSVETLLSWRGLLLCLYWLSTRPTPIKQN